MLVSAFASCGGDATQSTPKQTTKKPETTEDKPESEQMNLDLDSIDYDGTEVHIFHWKPDADYHEFGMNLADVNNDAVSNAIYQRNSYTETDLGITLDWQEQTGSIYTQTRSFIDRLESRVKDPNTPVDIIAAQARSMPYFMVEGHLTDLNTYSDSLDLTKAWWPENIQETFEIKDRLYFVSGDISANLLRNMTVIFVNKTMLESIGEDYIELMEKVKNYEWTLDDLIVLNEGMYHDVNDNGERDLEDKYGLITFYYHSDALYAGLGYQYMSKSSRDDQAFRLSSQIASETASNYIQKMKDWHATHDFHMYLPEKAYFEPFLNGNALFLIHRAWFGFELQKTDIKYAVLPTPALDTNQQRYYTTIGHQLTTYGVCSASPDYDIAAQTLQVLGYHAFSTTTPALFEVSFQGKFSKDDYTIEMFNIIRNSVVFDVGRIFDVFITTLDGGFETYKYYLLSNVVSFAIRGNADGTEISFNFPSTGDPTRRKVQQDLDVANKKIVDFIDSQS
jgi:ABC-type glycerol-3-phosphate transport system substrate-binding protein